MKHILTFLCMLFAYKAVANDTIAPEEMLALRIAAEDGSGNDAYRLAKIYETEKDYTSAKRWYELAAERHIGRAALRLYELHNDNHIKLGNPEGTKEAGWRMLQENANKNDDEAAYFLGKSLISGRFGKKNIHRAVYFLMHAQQLGNPRAALELSTLYSNGSLGMNSPFLAKYYLKQAAYANITPAYLPYAQLLLNEQKLSDAIYYFKKAAQLGDKQAMHTLVAIYTYEKPNHVLSKQWQQKLDEAPKLSH